jgi:hypothetical protein
MRRVPLAVMLTLAAILLSSCADNSPSPDTENTAHEAASWPYPFVVVENRVYVIKNDENNDELVAKEKIGEQIGIVQEKYEHPRDVEPSSLIIHSNYLEEGTKLFTIKDVDPSVQIAFEKSEGVFVKATEKSAVPKTNE